MKKLCNFLLGFTLVELLVVLVLVLILASVAVSVYKDQVTKAKRHDAIIALLDLSTRLEHYFAEQHTFKGASINALIPSEKSPKEYYKLSLTQITATDFTATATPLNAQLNADTKCGSFSINALGQRTISGPGPLKQCWR